MVLWVKNCVDWLCERCVGLMSDPRFRHNMGGWEMMWGWRVRWSYGRKVVSTGVWERCVRSMSNPTFTDAPDWSVRGYVRLLCQVIVWGKSCANGFEDFMIEVHHGERKSEGDGEWLRPVSVSRPLGTYRYLHSIPYLRASIHLLGVPKERSGQRRSTLCLGKTIPPIHSVTP